MTGEQLWDKPQVDDLMRVVLLENTHDIVLVTRQLDRKQNAMEIGAMVAGATIVGLPIASQIYTYPFKIELERLNPSTGKSAWNSEYSTTFHFDSHSIVASENHLLVFFDNSILASFDLKNGKFLWEDGSSRFGGKSLGIPLLISNGRVIYGRNHVVYAIDPSTGLADWRIEDTGKISGLSLCDGMVIVSGSKKVAAVDAATGVQRWSETPHGYVSNLLWDKHSDIIFYADFRGLHGLERTTGKQVFLSKSRSVYEPYMIRRESPEAIVILGIDGISAYNFKKDSEIYATRKLLAFYPGYTFHDRWPMPMLGEDLTVPQERNPVSIFSGGVSDDTLLSGDALERTKASVGDAEANLDAFRTVNELGRERFWWIDPESNLLGILIYGAAGGQQEVSRPLGMVFAADGKRIWGSKILRN
jgi:outer membrane protein assembly factor BamB